MRSFFAQGWDSTPVRLHQRPPTTVILAKYKIAYVAGACVYHSHPHTWKQKFSRYFDIGVLHSRESWFLNEFGKTGGEGARFALS